MSAKTAVGAENFSPLLPNPGCIGQPFLQWAGKRRIATPRAVSVSSMRQCPETRPLRSPRPPRCREHDSRITRQTAANARATFPCTVDARLRRPSWSREYAALAQRRSTPSSRDVGAALCPRTRRAQPSRSIPIALHGDGAVWRGAATASRSSVGPRLRDQRRRAADTIAGFSRGSN